MRIQKSVMDEMNSVTPSVKTQKSYHVDRRNSSAMSSNGAPVFRRNGEMSCIQLLYELSRNDSSTPFPRNASSCEKSCLISNTNATDNVNSSLKENVRRRIVV